MSVKLFYNRSGERSLDYWLDSLFEHAYWVNFDSSILCECELEVFSGFIAECYDKSLLLEA